jgi:oligoribonuclease (3'-5' exoribonuclease)
VENGETTIYDVMIDLETTGTDPTHSAIIQIAAVQFDYQTGAIGRSFNRCAWVPNNRYWAEDTREWWGKQKAEILDGIFDRAEDPALVMQGFVSWVQSLSALKQPRMWAKPISFEFPFLASYAKQFGYEMPFHFRDAIDLQSFIRGLRRQPDAEPFDKQVPFDGEAHDAIDDVYHQIKIALVAKGEFA